MCSGISADDHQWCLYAQGWTKAGRTWHCLPCSDGYEKYQKLAEGNEVHWEYVSGKCKVKAGGKWKHRVTTTAGPKQNGKVASAGPTQNENAAIDSSSSSESSSGSTVDSARVDLNGIALKMDEITRKLDLLLARADVAPNNA